ADYSMTTAGKGVPPRTPRFDFEAVDLDRATSSPDDKQVALLSDENPANPIWYGWGTKNGVEAGVDPEILNVHQFVGGSTGMGKTTLLVNYFRQIMQRGHGGLFFDPKGDDAADVVSL
ncbi:type IV secretion system DNA-binding domain-containing protein, partial [Klebsiella pneumoniae]|uniref:type IV secretion system DNA-binding domain-containing protein n=1 Tax=Klebsiella pneumoniae TaxID=573 RepID=UPI001C60491A